MLKEQKGKVEVSRRLGKSRKQLYVGTKTRTCYYLSAGMHLWLRHWGCQKGWWSHEGGPTGRTLPGRYWAIVTEVGFGRDAVTPKDHTKSTPSHFLPPSNFLPVLPLGWTYKAGLRSVVCRGPGPVMQSSVCKGKNGAENKQEITSTPYFLNVIFFPEMSPGSCSLSSTNTHWHSDISTVATQ